MARKWQVIFLIIPIIVLVVIYMQVMNIHVTSNNGYKNLWHLKNDVILMQEINRSRTMFSPESRGARRVPKIVHFTWGGDKEFQFHQMVCFLSAYYFIKPVKIMFWYATAKPKGKWWTHVKDNITNFKSVVQLIRRRDPTTIFDIPIRVPEHRSDIVRLAVMLNYGGIYLDLDVLVLKSFDPLLVYETTLGREVSDGLCNGIIISQPRALFLRIWWEEYRTFEDSQWGDHSVRLPSLLAERYPWLIHVENDTMNRPNWEELDLIYGDKPYDFSDNYSVHLWFRLYNKQQDLETIRTLNSTYGRMCRYVLFGNSNMTKV